MVTLPTGNKYALASYKGTFAMVPVNEGGTVHGALRWATREDAEEHLQNQIDLTPSVADLGEFEVLEYIEGH